MITVRYDVVDTRRDSPKFGFLLPRRREFVSMVPAAAFARRLERNHAWGKSKRVVGIPTIDG